MANRGVEPRNDQKGVSVRAERQATFLKNSYTINYHGTHT
nr:MAG TPA_asm: hypothetical protein [Caudoviricetes sp.]